MRDRLLGTLEHQRSSKSICASWPWPRHVNFLRLLGGDNIIVTWYGSSDYATRFTWCVKTIGQDANWYQCMRIAKADGVKRVLALNMHYPVVLVIADLSDPLVTLFRTWFASGHHRNLATYVDEPIQTRWKMWSGLITQSKVLKAANTLDAGGLLTNEK